MAAGIERLDDLIFNQPQIVLSLVLLVPTDMKFMDYIINISNKLYSNNLKNQILDHFNL